jgi:hypothetical protein
MDGPEVMESGGNANAAVYETLFPYMVTYGIVHKKNGPQSISEGDLVALATRWKVKAVKDKRKDGLVRALYAHCEQFENRVDTRKYGAGTVAFNANISMYSEAEHIYFEPDKTPSVRPLKVNYFGLPIHALNQTALGLVYQGRKPNNRIGDSEDDTRQNKQNEQDSNVLAQDESDVEEKPKKDNRVAQNKVAKALLAIASNPATVSHFVLQGGMDAIFKLAFDAQDHDTLATCARCIAQAADTAGNRKPMMDKQVLTVITHLIENGGDTTRRFCAECLCRLSCSIGLEDALISGGMMLAVQSLLNLGGQDTISYSALSLTNVALVLTGAEAESLIRAVLLGVRRLDFQTHFESALFVSCVLNGLSRISHYVSLLTDEGVLPVVISLMESVRPDWGEVISYCVELLINLSMMRKNRRDISQCGLAEQLKTVFLLGSGKTRAYMLMIIGNLLSSGLFSEKVSKEEIITDIISMMDPAEPQQFIGAAFCVCHMSMTESSSNTMVQCHLVPKILSLLAESDVKIDQATAGYLWTTLVNLSVSKSPFRRMVVEPRLAFIISAEVGGGGTHQDVATRLMLNISAHPEVHPDLMPGHLFESVIVAFKALFARGEDRQIQMLIVNVLINLGIRIPNFLVFILGTDLIQLLEDFGTEVSSDFNHRFLELLCLISSQEYLCPRMVDHGVQRLLMALHPKLSEKGKDHLAATLHNLSLKRALVGPGVLNALVSSTRNCKTIRILWCCRAIAYMSSFSKSRATLAKEKRIIPRLSNIMRFGCEQAERVQYYCGVAICNITSSSIDKSIIEDLIKSGAVVDLVVVTLLRVNDVYTKEALGKALFNLLTRADVRMKLVESLSVFEALLDLGRVELIDMLELSINTAYNISCDKSVYAIRMEILKLPSILVARLINSPELHGCRATGDIKMMCGKTVANMSFDKALALSFSRDKMIAEACYAVLQLKRDEATYCSAVTIFNMSKLDDCLKLAGTLIVPCLSSAVSTGPILCTQLAVAALCNFSRFALFHEQITSMVSQNLIKLLSSPQVDFAVKLDIIHTLYNIVTDYTPSRALFVEHGIVSSLVKVCKSIDNEETLAVIGRILRELCQHTEAVRLLISEGIMPLLLRLSKLENPTLKIDIADALYTLSGTNESNKLLKLDVVHILFWLTLYDCLSLNDIIMRYVSKTLRNFTIAKEDSAILCEEERFFHVVKALSKKGNSENVVWQTAAVIYNLLNINDEIRAVLVKRSVVQTIFDLAICGYTSVMHLCSASLHTVTDHIPNVENPIVLELITSLLDAEDDQLSQLLHKTTEEVGYSQFPSPFTSDFEHEGTGFKATWSVLTCDLETAFKPTMIDAETSRSERSLPANLATAVKFDPPVKIEGSKFGGFNNETKPNPPVVPPLLKPTSLVTSSGAPRRVSTTGHTLEDAMAAKKARFKLDHLAEDDKTLDSRLSSRLSEEDEFEASYEGDGYSSEEASLQSGTVTARGGAGAGEESEHTHKQQQQHNKTPTKQQQHGPGRKSIMAKKPGNMERRGSHSDKHNMHGDGMGAKKSSRKPSNSPSKERDEDVSLQAGQPPAPAPLPAFLPRPHIETEEEEEERYQHEEDETKLRAMASHGDIQIIGRSSSTGHLGGKLGDNKGHIHIQSKLTHGGGSGSVGAGKKKGPPPPSKSPTAKSPKVVRYSPQKQQVSVCAVVQMFLE